MFYGVFLGCVIGQILLSAFGFQTPHESFVGAFWQLSGVVACGLTQRALDKKRALAKSDSESAPAAFRQ